jgi:hypothetical protein
MAQEQEYKNMNDLLLHMQSVLQRMNAGNLHAEELNEAVESARMLYERLIVIRHRAYDRLGKGDSLSSAYNFRLDRYVPINQTSLFDAIHEVEVEKSKGEQSSLFTLEEESVDVETTDEKKTTQEDPAKAEEIPEVDLREAEEPELIQEEQLEGSEAPPTNLEEETNEVPQESEDAPIVEEEVMEEGVASESEQTVQTEQEATLQPEKKSPKPENTGSTSIAEKLEKTPLADLKSAIGLNRKFQFINTLFEGDGSAYDSAIQFLNQDENAAEVSSWIENNLPKEFEDEDEQNVLIAFIELIERRHA